MELRELFEGGDDRAVSPVIGVILMVAITVILAAVIGTFVLGLGENVQSTAPSASFAFDYDGGTSVTITHESGDVVSANLVSVVGDVDYSSTSSLTDADGDSTSDEWGSSSDTISAGDSKTITTSTASSPTIRVVWNSESGDNSATLGEFTGA
jgi:flagellin-like protein